LIAQFGVYVQAGWGQFVLSLADLPAAWLG